MKSTPACSQATATTTPAVAPEPAPGEKPTRTVERWPLDMLQPHPRNAALFDDLSEQKLSDLAQDLKERGQITPLEILADGTIVCGHQRVRAARQLGWTDIEAIVLRELGDQEVLVIEERLIADNLHRRELDPLARARCLRRLKELTYEKMGRRRYRGSTDLRDELAQQFGLSGRQLSRLERLLDAPREVQRAVSAGRLTQKAAHDVTFLDKELQEQIDRKIAAGGEPRKVVAPYLAKSDGRHKKATAARAAFSRNLEKSLQDLEGRLDQCHYLLAEEEPLFRRAHELLSQLLALPPVNPMAWAERLSAASQDRAAELPTTTGGRENEPDTMSGTER
ncbi:MAG: ParB N-terminal domain-containing protein [Planctomycetia bacterium]|nr:ParB N-terminal domain-containing protein [Planctomycetia bacterium]